MVKIRKDCKIQTKSFTQYKVNNYVDKLFIFYKLIIFKTCNVSILYILNKVVLYKIVDLDSGLGASYCRRK